jgi:hypothetical protein
MTNKESLVQQQSCTDLLHFRSAGCGVTDGEFLEMQDGELAS